MEAANEEFYSKGIENEEDYQKNKEKLAEFEERVQVNKVNALRGATDAILNLTAQEISRSKMAANEKKGILLGIALIEGAASAVTAIQSGWNTGITFYDKLALAIAGGVEAAATTAAQITAIESQSFATGTRHAPGGWSMVGEQGPELMHVPRGSQIYNNQQSSTMMNTGHTFHISINASNSVAETLHAEIRAGDVGVQKLLTLIGSKIS